MKTLLIFSYILLVTCFYSEAQLLTFKHFNHKSGLNMAQVNCISQEKNGLLWIGTGGGELVNYDGEIFTETPFDDNQNHHFTHLEIINDEIYFSSRYLGFFNYSIENKKLHKFDLRNSLFGEAIAIYKDAEFTYFVGSKKIIELPICFP